MKFCAKCGNEVLDEAVICPKCGCSLSASGDASKQNNIIGNVEDKANGGLIALSILIPIAGIILWPLKHKETPKAAMTYGICGIASWVVFGAIISII